MKNSQLCRWITLIVGLSFPSCKKQLNVFPTTSAADGNVIIDEKSAQSVLNGVYYRFEDVRTDGFTGKISTLVSDINESIPSQFTGSIFDPYGFSPPNSATLPLAGVVDSLIWDYCYALVNAANGFIKNMAPVANVPAGVKQQMLAEARFLRAYGNSELLLYYGQYNDPGSKYGIILRDTFVSSANTDLPRSDVATAYASILADLDATIPGLPTLNSTLYYANASAAKLLKARVLMNRGAAGDYAEVVSLTNDIITNGPFVLEDSLKDIFLTKGFGSKEVILGIQPYPNQSRKYIKYQVYNELLASDSLVSLLANDARHQWVYKYALDNAGRSANELTKYYSGDPTNILQTPLTEFCYVFRLSEAYLLEAEAMTLSTGDLATAKTLLTTVMTHAGAGPQELTAVANAATSEALQLEIVKENMRNFTYENGVDWLALRRLPFATIQQLNPNIKDASRLILPIPTAELAENKVIQNPGY